MKTLLALLLLIPNLIWSSSDEVLIDPWNDICYSKSEEEFLKCTHVRNDYGNYTKGGGTIKMISKEYLYEMYKKCSMGNKKICSQIDTILKVQSNNNYNN